MTFAYHQIGHSVRGLANYVLDYAEQQGFAHSNMGINKLAYFAVRALLIKRNRLLTKAKIEAWEHGPVFRELYQDFKASGDGPVRTRAKSFNPGTRQFEIAKIDLTEDDKRDVVEAITPLLPLTASQLRAFSHRQGEAWDRVWSYKGRANPGMEITPSLILEAAYQMQGDFGEVR